METKPSWYVKEAGASYFTHMQEMKAVCRSIVNRN
jgi:hypothetical protein